MTTVETTPANAAGAPTSDIDLHTDDNLKDPYPAYAELRELGPLVWLSQYDMYAFPRYAEVLAALGDWDTYSSSEGGVGFNEYFNAIRETSLMTSGAHHDEIRRVEGRPVRRDQLTELEKTLKPYAERVVADAVNTGKVEGVADLAARLPLDVITELVGLDDAGRDKLYGWGVAGFDSIGPLRCPRTGPALETMGGYFAYAAENIPSKIREGGWADQLFKNGKAVGWSEEFCRGVMNDYVYPALDTTIHSISTGLLLFGQNPDEWDRLRADRSLLNTAAHEIVRLTTPIQYFTRVLTKDVDIDGLTLPTGSRVIVMFASANRDDRQFDNPDGFDIGRSSSEHVGWGKGKHACMGQALARLELTTFFDALADKVERIEVGDFDYQPNNIIRGLAHLDLTLVPAK